ncbi:MAG: phenylalanine--tRNA ligase subunit beta [Candidatus Saccharibacteria bacterium]|nr:phenylalanine--tRNA ligase subunit beta [Candidatus Saccharibacteria bacterium]
MKVSLDIVQQLVGFELPAVDELVERVNARLGGVEAVIDLGQKYQGARIVRVVECAKHPDADRLTVTKIDDGGVVPDMPRDENGLVQVVCGAPNVHADMWAIWLPPKSVVPASVDEGEPFVLDARPLRGVLSQGMLAAADELAIGSDHDGIVEITERDMPQGQTLSAGADFAKVFGLKGHVLEIENKMFTHRPDCLGQLGVAREMAGIFGQAFTSPDWYNVIQEFADASGLELQAFNDDTALVPSLRFVALDSVTVGPSPLWLQCQLVAMGGKPINNIVDATNYLMLMTAQPTHAYDYDKLRGQTIGARLARAGETVRLLNGKNYELTSDDIVIADAEGVIGLAGVMGGSDTEVSAETTRVVLECGTFDMYAVRKTAMRHGIFTDALARFNKGQSPLQTSPVLGQLMQLVGGRQASPVFSSGSDAMPSVLTDGLRRTRGMTVPPGFVAERLGQNLSDADMQTLLRNVEFLAEDASEYGEAGLMVFVPFWRQDIALPEDIVEEVGRLHGFDQLPRELPRRAAQPAPKNSRRQLKQAVRDSLSRTGANEVLTYSFVHEQLIQKAEQDVSQAYKLSNALSPDLQYYRLTVLPSLLDKVHMNIKAGHDEFALFEMGKGHIKMHGLGEDGLPEASQFTDLVYAAKKPGRGAPFYRVRRLVEQLGRDLGCELRFKPIEQALDFPVTAPFDQARSALVETADGQFIGMVGELKQSVIKQFKLPSYVAAATLDTAGLEKVYTTRRSSYQPLSRYPSTSRDLSLKVDTAVSYAAIADVITEALQAQNDLTVRLTPVAIYQPADDSSTKTVTFRLTFVSHDKTLTDADITPLMQRIVAQVNETHGAVEA